MAQTLARPNRYPANCIRCNARIPAGDGLLARTDDGSWAADHPEDCPPKATPAQPVVIARASEDGIYRTADGTIYKVQIAKRGSGHLYAKRLTVSPCADGAACGHPTVVQPNGTHMHGHFDYAPGVIHTLRADQKLPHDQAARYGQMYGICCACGADLTDENSIKRGIGPVCAKYFD